MAYFFVALLVGFAAVSYFVTPQMFRTVPQSIVRTGENVIVSPEVGTSTASGTGAEQVASSSANNGTGKKNVASTTQKKSTGSAYQKASPSSALPPMPEQGFVAKSFVGLLCHFKADTVAVAQAYGDANGEILVKGSGVIVNPEGYILTVRHLVDPEWTNWAYASSTSESMRILNANITFEYCEVATPTSDTLPDMAAIQRINPNITVNHPFLYLATLYFAPLRDNLSDYEYGYLDFAILKITSPMHNCAQFNACTLPTAYPYSLSRYSDVPQKGTSLVNFGYPAELFNSSASTFNDFYLKGTIGYVTDYFGGDLFFKNEPFTFEWTANDVLEGRSGSPLLWNGYVVGIQTSANADNSADDFALGMPAIQEVLSASGNGNLLATK